MRISLVRHGQSTSNVGLHDHSAAGDHLVHLTQLGRDQAVVAGALLFKELQEAFEDTTLVYCSPYTRTRETLARMFTGAMVLDQLPRVYEDARLREVEHGYGAVDAQEPLRPTHGYFYYRYAGGESPADCFDRMSSFLESLMRQVERKRANEVVIVTHGLSIRCFLMRFLHLTVEQFETMANPGNCDIITIDRVYNLTNPIFTNGRWGVEGIKLRASKYTAMEPSA